MQNKVIPRNLLNWKNKNKNKTVKDNNNAWLQILSKPFHGCIQK